MPFVRKLPPGAVVPRILGLLLGAAWLAGAPALERLESERLVFLLQHMQRDYDRAVRDGRVVNTAEYDEIRGMIAGLRARFVAGHDGSGGSKVATGLAQLETGIRNREPAERVGARIAELVQAVSPGNHGLLTPGDKPDLKRGRELYLRDCASCHGTTGGGDGWAAVGMIPAPGSLADPAVMKSIEPQHVWGAVRFGIEGTAMPSYEDAYPSGEAWDVTAFVMTLKDSAVAPAAHDADLDVARRLEHTLTSVAERVLPSVVGISLFRRQTEGSAKHAAEHGPGWQQDGLDDLYPGYERTRSRSGVLASDDGYVLTCGHLFEPSDAPPADVIVDVESNGGQHFRAWIVGIEPTVDLAVLKVEAPIGLPPATLGDSDAVRTGRFAIAVGDPPGPDLTFALGTIAAKAKEECYQDDRTSTLLQWSSHVVAESLGGPLVDLDGNVIGITVPAHDILHAGQADGPTYALPIKLVRTLFEALKVKQSTKSPWLGFAVRPLEWERRRATHAPQFGGIEIVNVFDPSPASRLGIRVGDLLMEMDGNRINAVHDFQYWLYVIGIDKPVTLKLFRDGGTIELRATIERRPAEAVPR
jgi:S1-C subfamily serine protease